MIKKKGQGLSLNTIVMAVLVLVVLVVLVMIFSSKITDSNKQLQSCSTLGGVCETKSYNGGCPDSTKKAAFEETNCEAQGKICCKDLS